jgi:hypothetical protein
MNSAGKDIPASAKTEFEVAVVEHVAQLCVTRTTVDTAVDSWKRGARGQLA